jgi:hypothetical protein
MDPKILDRFRFDTGIERIFHREEIPHRPHLPDVQAPLIPSENQLWRHLEAALNLTPSDGFLLASMLPKITNPSILLPRKYYKIMGRIANILKTLAEEGDEDAKAGLLGEAVQFFEEERELLLLLHHYRNLLHQG